VGTAVLAAAVLGETLSPVGISGIALVGLGTVLVGMPPRSQWSAKKAALPLLIVGVAATLAGSSAYAKVAVELVHPVVLDFWLFFGAALLLMPFGIRIDGRAQWKANARECLIIGIGSPLSYLIALYAFQLGPVSYLSSLRESSVVMGTVLGALVYRESITVRRAAGIALILVGVVLLRLA
jgi:drug/metabolite transporter (DMT)-like permease